MNTNTESRRTSTFARRAMPALAIVILAVGLGACQTPRGEAVPQAPVVQQADASGGIAFGRPVDRIAAEIERRAQAPARFRGMTADRIVEQLAREQDRLKGMTADPVREQARREAAGAPVFY